MKPTVFLHIGTNKTGTTAIQSTLNQQRRQLLDFGVLYPLSGCSGNAHYGLSDYLGFRYVMKGSEATADEIFKLQESLQIEVERTQCEQIILSSENFALPKAIAPVREFFADYAVKIVLYLRRHDSWWESDYNQAVKMVLDPPWQPGFQNYLRFQRKNRYFGPGSYRFLVDRWGQAFGKENIIVRPFEASQNQPHIVADFFNAIGLAHITEKIDLTPLRANESLPAYNLMLTDVFQRAKVAPDIRKKLLEYAESCVSEKDKFSIISPALRRQLVDYNSKVYAYIAKEYLGRDDGQLFFDPLPDPNEAWQAPAALSDVEIVEKTVAALQANSWQKIFKLPTSTESYVVQ